jgi:hypothetical protein
MSATRCYEAAAKARVLEIFFAFVPQGIDGPGNPFVDEDELSQLSLGIETIVREIREVVELMNPEISHSAKGDGR